MPMFLASSSGPVDPMVRAAAHVFHGAARMKVFWQDRNSSRSSGVAMPEALKKSSYWRMRCGAGRGALALGAMQ